MSRYKGRASSKSLERDFPHIVETIVPLGGFGRTLDKMHEWHTHRGIHAIQSTGRRDKDGRNYIRWCFADSVVAAQFVNEFGGAVGRLD